MVAVTLVEILAGTSGLPVKKGGVADVCCVVPVSREPHSGRVACLFGWVCVTSPRPISTGRLGITAVYLRPINPVVCWGPYPVIPVGNLILKRASRLDAFSGYHFRT
jgi:hypothetical protein